jgi:hypothetical protein
MSHNGLLSFTIIKSTSGVPASHLTLSKTASTTIFSTWRELDSDTSQEMKRWE